MTKEGIVITEQTRKALSTFILNWYKYPSINWMLWFLRRKRRMIITDEDRNQFITIARNVQRGVRKRINNTRLNAAKVAEELYPYDGNENDEIRKIRREHWDTTRRIVMRLVLNGHLDISCPARIQSVVKIIQEFRWIETRPADEIPYDGSIDSKFDSNYKGQL